MLPLAIMSENLNEPPEAFPGSPQLWRKIDPRVRQWLLEKIEELEALRSLEDSMSLPREGLTNQDDSSRHGD
jgi:hypothetical protein